MDLVRVQIMNRWWSSSKSQSWDLDLVRPSLAGYRKVPSTLLSIMQTTHIQKPDSLGSNLALAAISWTSLSIVFNLSGPSFFIYKREIIMRPILEV